MYLSEHHIYLARRLVNQFLVAQQYCSESHEQVNHELPSLSLHYSCTDHIPHQRA